MDKVEKLCNKNQNYSQNTLNMTRLFKKNHADIKQDFLFFFHLDSHCNGPRGVNEKICWILGDVCEMKTVPKTLRLFFPLLSANVVLILAVSKKKRPGLPLLMFSDVGKTVVLYRLLKTISIGLV